MIVPTLRVRLKKTPPQHTANHWMMPSRLAQPPRLLAGQNRHPGTPDPPRCYVRGGSGLGGAAEAADLYLRGIAISNKLRAG